MVNNQIWLSTYFCKYAVPSTPIRVNPVVSSPAYSVLSKHSRVSTLTLPSQWKNYPDSLWI